MPRNISFFYTTEQIKNRTKTVTRRIGWDFLKVGDILNACEKCQGLKKDEKIKVICQIRIVDVRKERLSEITKKEIRLEGFPGMDPFEFITMFVKHMDCRFNSIINRIEFEYI